jgi:hypothetical protein
VYVAVGFATSGTWPYYDQPPNLLMVMCPLFGAVGGWQAAPSPEAVYSFLKMIPRLVAKYVAALVPWAMVVFVLVYSLEWFGGYESWTNDSAFKRVLVFLLVPPAILCVAITLMRLAWSKPESVHPPPVPAWGPTEAPKENSA